MKKEWILLLLIIFLIPFSKADIVISEVMWNHNVNSNCRYMELYNNGASSVDLSAWKTKAKASQSWQNFGDITISAGEYIIIAHKLTGSGSYESVCYGNNDGNWDSNDASYNAVDGNVNTASSSDTASIQDDSGTLTDTFDYGQSYGGNGDGNSIHLLGNGSIASGSSTQGSASGISYCGDNSCNGAEDCNNCSSDCGACSYCGDGTKDAGESCDGSDLNSQTCILQGFDSGILSCYSNCTFDTSSCSINPPSYCGDGICDANESCSNCSSDCSLSSTQCCSVSSSNADSHGIVNSTYTTTSGNICCSGTEYEGGCCTDAECSSPNVCASNICVAPYAGACTSESCSCDLSLSIQANATFNSGISNSYYLHLKDLMSNFTGTSTITYWIENSSGILPLNSYKNITITINENKTLAYSPIQKCSSSLNYLKAKILTFGCNDSSSANNEVSSTITIPAESCSTASTEDTSSEEESEEAVEEAETEEIVYSINVPSKLEITEEEMSSGSVQKTVEISVNLENNKNKTKEFEVWSYVYLGDSCYSCYNGEEGNKVVLSLDSGVSDTIDLENLLNITEQGTYKVKVKVLDVETSELKEFEYDIEVGSSSEFKTESSVSDDNSSKASSKEDKIKFYSLLLFFALMAITAGFFGYQYRDMISEFIKERKKAFNKKKDWKEYLEERRGKGIFERLSSGFMKSQKK